MARTLTPKDQAKAARLKELWNARKKDLNLTQEKAAEMMGYANQGVVSQFLNGMVALSAEATLKFSKLLMVPPSRIDPDIQAFAFADDAPRRVRVPVLTYLDGSKPQRLEFIEIATTMDRSGLYAVGVNNDSLEPMAPAGSHLIIASDEEPNAGDDVFIERILPDGTQRLMVARFVMVNASNSTLVIKELAHDVISELPMDQVSLYAPIVAVERPRAVRQKRVQKPRLSIVS